MCHRGCEGALRACVLIGWVGRKCERVEEVCDRVCLLRLSLLFYSSHF